jgi:uridylate kinase
MKSKYKRIVLKLSGEVVSGKQGFGFSTTSLNYLIQEIKDATDTDVEIGIVVGGGNIFRGKKSFRKLSIDRVRADYIGILSTLINSIIIQNLLESSGISSSVMSVIDVGGFAEPFSVKKAKQYLKQKYIVIFACGTGNPFFTTDTSAVLKAIETEAELLLKGTKVDGIYDKDPLNYKNAKFYSRVSYDFALENHLQIMDSTAFSLAMENKVKIIVFNILKKGNLKGVLEGKDIGSTITD